MFTGIIEATGKIDSLREEAGSLSLVIRSNFKNLKAGESIAVDGVCLTVLKKSKTGFAMQAGEESLRKTALGSLKKGQTVNLERAMRPSDRLGGHIVQGHVDGTGQILKIQPEGGSKLYYFSYPGKIEPYIVPKGSIAVSGISLTVVNATENSFSVSVLPYTEENTSLSDKEVGDKVNLEADIVAKIVAHQAEIYKRQSQNPMELYQKMEFSLNQIIKED